MMTATTFNSNLSIGLLVFWELNDTKITPGDLRAVLSTAGIDPAVVPDIDQPAAVRRAARQWSQGRGNADRFRAEVVFDDGKRVEVGLLRRERVDEHEVKWVQVDVLAYDVDASTGTVSRDYAVGTDYRFDAERDSLRECVDSARSYLDHEWIRPHVVQARLAAMSALPVRRAGAIAFVPRCHEHELRQLQAVVRAIGASEFEAIAIDPADRDARATVERRATENLGSGISDLANRLDEWEKAARSVPAHAAASILEQVGDLLTRGDLYASALGVARDDPADRLDLVKLRARSILMGEHLDERQAPTSPAAGGDSAVGGAA